mgnify:CR=1 FL=1
MKGKNPRTQSPGKLPESVQKTGIGKTGLPEGKYTRDTRGDNQECLPFLFDSVLCHLQHTGTIAGFGLIAMDGKILIYFRTVIMEGVLCTV